MFTYIIWISAHFYEQKKTNTLLDCFLIFLSKNIPTWHINQSSLQILTYIENTVAEITIIPVYCILKDPPPPYNGTSYDIHDIQPIEATSSLPVSTATTVLTTVAVANDQTTPITTSSNTITTSSITERWQKNSSDADQKIRDRLSWVAKDYCDLTNHNTLTHFYPLSVPLIVSDSTKIT